MQIADFLAGNGGPGRLQIKAGATISQNDAIEMGPDGFVYPVQVTDCAVVSAANTNVIAPTTVNAVSNAPYYDRIPFKAGLNGDLFIVAINPGTNNGLIIYRYASTGALISSVIVVTGIAATAFSLMILSNGSVALVYNDAASNFICAIYDFNLSPIKSTILTGMYNYNAHAISLSGGGLMFVYQDKTTTSLQRVMTLDNTGNIVTASSTIQTWTGTAGVVYTKLVELSNQNVAVCCVSNYTTSPGLYVGVLNPAGGIVAALANFDSVHTGNWIEAYAMNGFFAVAHWDGSVSANLVRVLNNAGASQGSFSVSAIAQSGPNMRITSDGINFWMTYFNTGGTLLNIIKISTSGALLYTYAPPSFANSGGQNTMFLDMFFERGRLVIAYQNSSVSSLYYLVFNTSTLGFEAQGLGAYGPITTNLTLLPFGDFTFALCWVGTNPSTQTGFVVTKYANSAIIGAANSAATNGTLASVSATVGAYGVNPIKGSPSKLFDHSAANIYGNKGALLNNGITLKGM